MRNLSLKTVFPLMAVAALCGCTSVNSTLDTVSYSMKSSLNMIPATQCTAFWSSAVRHDPSLEKPERGFGGRAYFYGADGRHPVKLGDGHIVIYAFDEEGRAFDDVKPTRSYVFPPKEVAKLYCKSELGHSYNLWVPWDTEGPEGNAKQVSLIVKYMPPQGSAIVSSQAKVYLAGKLGDQMLANKAGWDSVKHSNRGIEQVAYHADNGIAKKERDFSPLTERVVEEGRRPAQMQTTTITRNDRASGQGPTVVTRTPAPTVAAPQPVYGQAYSAAGQNQPNAVIPATYHPTSLYSPVPAESVPAGQPVAPMMPASAPTFPSGQSVHSGFGAPPAPFAPGVQAAYVPADFGQPLVESRSTLPHQVPIRR